MITHRDPLIVVATKLGAPEDELREIHHDLVSILPLGKEIDAADVLALWCVKEVVALKRLASAAQALRMKLNGVRESVRVVSQHASEPLCGSFWVTQSDMLNVCAAVTNIADVLDALVAQEAPK